MSTVRIKANGQVTLPATLREKAGLKTGDLLEANIERGRITLTPKSLLDSGIAESLNDYQEGRFYGPFDSADEMIGSLRSRKKSGLAKTRSRK